MQVDWEYSCLPIGIFFECVPLGPTASGKSALLLALLGELTLVPGGRLFLPKDPASVDENGLSNSISYCAQTPCKRVFNLPLHPANRVVRA